MEAAIPRSSDVWMSLIGFSITSSAHHSRAEFSETVEEITGELVSVSWTNPRG